MPTCVGMTGRRGSRYRSNSPACTLAIALFRIATIASSATLRDSIASAPPSSAEAIDTPSMFWLDHVFDRLVHHRAGVAQIGRGLIVGS